MKSLATLFLATGMLFPLNPKSVNVNPYQISQEVMQRFEGGKDYGIYLPEIIAINDKEKWKKTKVVGQRNYFPKDSDLKFKNNYHKKQPHYNRLSLK
jgi:hypothetical protein